MGYIRTINAILRTQCHCEALRLFVARCPDLCRETQGQEDKNRAAAIFNEGYTFNRVRPWYPPGIPPCPERHFSLENLTSIVYISHSG